jgi:Alpha/beta hydrolase domain
MEGLAAFVGRNPVSGALRWRVAFRAGVPILLALAATLPIAHGDPQPAGAAVLSAPATVPRAVVSGPVTGGTGIDLPGTTSFNLASVGYEQSEYFLAGTATAYTSATPLTSNGRWEVTPASTAPYKTRMVVYRPINPKRFDGTVVVEWLNVSGGVDAAAAWLTDHVQMIRSGMVYIGVSAQATGIVGATGTLGAANGQAGGIKGADPARYGSLEHPGDSYSYSIFEQAGAAIRRDAALVLGGLKPTRLLALGESQSATRLVTYIDALQPQSEGVYNGYFVYSRFASSAALSQAPQAAINPPGVVLIRTDLTVPVMMFETEADVAVLGYDAARQPPTRYIREWEVAGTAHYDTYGLVESMADTGNGAADVEAFDTMINPVSSFDGGAISCPVPLNAGAHTYELRAAVVALGNWVTSGTPPPQSPRLDVAGPGTYVTNTLGESEGGIRTPQVAAPVAVVNGTGDTSSAGGGFCKLFGTTIPFSAAKLAQLYPTHADFVKKWDAAVAADVAKGYLLSADARILDRVAEQSTVGG